MADPATEFGKSIDLIHINCGAHFQTIDENPKDQSVLLACLACSKMVIVREFVPQKPRTKHKPAPDPGELEVRSDQEIANDTGNEPTEPQETDTEPEPQPQEE